MKLNKFKMMTVAFCAIVMFLVGCSSKTDELYQESIQKGLDAIAENDFSKAEGLFEVALEAKENDVKAKAYLNQVQLIIKSDDLEKENKINDAVVALDKSIKVKDGSKVISSKS